MMFEVAAPLVRCNCLALRQAARHVTQFYDERLAPTGLRTTQFSILAKLERLGPTRSMHLRASWSWIERRWGAQCCRLSARGLISVRDGRVDRRSKELALTSAGAKRLRAAARLWGLAQREFERRFGVDRAHDLRTLLAEVVACRLDGGSETSSLTRGGANA
jgi:DNA-binding MarR family transcriptional regulator